MDIPRCPPILEHLVSLNQAPAVEVDKYWSRGSRPRLEVFGDKDCGVDCMTFYRLVGHILLAEVGEFGGHLAFSGWYGMDGTK